MKRMTHTRQMLSACAVSLPSTCAGRLYQHRRTPLTLAHLHLDRHALLLITRQCFVLAEGDFSLCHVDTLKPLFKA